MVEHFPKEDLPDPDFFPVNGFLGAAEHHPCMERALCLALDTVQDRLRASIFVITGPVVLMTAVNQLSPADRNGAVILRHFDVWGKILVMTPAGYNDNGQPWSEREARGELPYR